MPRALEIPVHLKERPVRRSEAIAAGVSPTVLRRRFTALFAGVFWFGAAPTDVRRWVDAALLVLPPDAVASHLTALRLWRIDIGALFPLHFSTRSSSQTRQQRLVLHRRIGELRRHRIDGFTTTTPERTFVDCATLLGLRDLVRIGDALVDAGLISLGALADFCRDSHLDGVVRARRAVRFVREGVESFLETDVRLLLIFARLPIEACNVDIHGDDGLLLGRGDIPFFRFKVLVEYDGWQHERDARQRQKDHLRRERLEAAGWILIVITAQDMSDPSGIVRRVHAALVRRGYAGPTPRMSVVWFRWFAAQGAPGPSAPRDLGRKVSRSRAS